MGETITSIDSSADFDAAIADGVVLADFWAPWCGPCRMQLPILEKMAGQFADRAKIVKVNVDDQSGLAERMDISSIPSLFLLKNGEMIQQFVGVQSEKILETALENALRETACV